MIPCPRLCRSALVRRMPAPGFILALAVAAHAAAPSGYYRHPALNGDAVVFTAEGDLWRVGVQGGVAQRLTTHPGEEGNAAFSPDGRTLAFDAEYEGPTEVYTMPAEGGRPTRRTYEGGGATTVGWTPDGRLLYSYGRNWDLPDRRMAALKLEAMSVEWLPLSQASRGAFDASGRTLFFTRLPFHGGNVKRYRGGTAETLWKYTFDETEATPLTADFTGTSRAPMWWDGRVYFLSDRDGSMNIWSMNPNGAELRQHTKHQGWDAKSPSLDRGRIAYQYQADLRLLDLASGRDEVIPITLASDFDHQREKWIKKPLDYVTTAHLSTNGDRVVLTARGQVFVATVGPGRFVEVTRRPDIRYRNARFLPDGNDVLAMSDESGEVEFVRLPANGVGASQPLTTNGTVLRWEGVPAPNGRWIAWSDKDLKLWIYNFTNRETRLLATSPRGDFGDLAWSPDSRWLAYVKAAENLYGQIWLYDTISGSQTALTSDRVDSHEPAWSPDGKWIYFLSDRNLESLVSSPWGPRQPEPFFDHLSKLFLVALQKDLRSPFEPPNELHPAGKERKPARNRETAPKSGPKPEGDGKEAKAPTSPKDDAAEKSEGASAGETNKNTSVQIDFDGIAARVWEAPLAPGNYGDLSVNDKRVFFTSRESARGAKRQLQVLDITAEDPKPKTLVDDVRSYELSLDGKKLLVRKGDVFHVEDAAAGAPAKLEKSVDLKNWTFSLEPRAEWRQMFAEAWRLERDYFYDRKMHGLDWPAMLKKYQPLVDRVTDRAELNDLIGDMVSELSALHIRTVGGDQREGPDQIRLATLGARLERDDGRGGWRVAHIYQNDPDYPNGLSPLARPGVNIRTNDVIEMINGVPTLSAPHPQALLRHQAGQQVLLRVRSAGAETNRDEIVTPISANEDANLRYAEWEYTRRLRVEEQGRGDLGYVHLRAMGADDMAQWTRDYYPVHRRKGLIIDVRHNRGGNIDSWILGRLLRRAWFYWQPRVGEPTWNMHYAFRGHLVLLCDEFTASDGEAFAEGFKRLSLGKVIGKRTWGGEIWLSASNFLVDRGIATAAEIGVYGPEGQWLIEGHGVEPDIVVDNLPRETFNGRDAQLERAIEYLQEQIRRQPVEIPPTPGYPDKSK